MEEIRLYSRKEMKNRLPDGRNGNNGPKKGSIIVVDKVHGKLIPRQIRTYDESGNPIKDIDFKDHKGLGSPHAHDWNNKGAKAPNKSRDKKGRLLTDKEKEELKNILDKLSRVECNGINNQVIENGFHDEEISSITLKNNTVIITTDQHIISFIAVIDANLNNLCLHNVFSNIEFESILVIEQEKNSISVVSQDKSSIEAIIQSSVGVYGVIICHKIKIRTKKKN